MPSTASQGRLGLDADDRLPLKVDDDKVVFLNSRLPSLQRPQCATLEYDDFCVSTRFGVKNLEGI